MRLTKHVRLFICFDFWWSSPNSYHRFWMSRKCRESSHPSSQNLSTGLGEKINTVPTLNKHTPNKHFPHIKHILLTLTKMCLFGEEEDFGKINSLFFVKWWYVREFTVLLININLQFFILGTKWPSCVWLNFGTNFINEARINLYHHLYQILRKNKNQTSVFSIDSTVSFDLSAVCLREIGSAYRVIGKSS